MVLVRVAVHLPNCPKQILMECHFKRFPQFEKVLVEQGLGKFCDPDFVRYTSREMQEALNMTSEEMDAAAHQLLLQERGGAGPGDEYKSRSPSTKSPNRQQQFDDFSNKQL